MLNLVSFPLNTTGVIVFLMTVSLAPSRTLNINAFCVPWGVIRNLKL